MKPLLLLMLSALLLPAEEPNGRELLSSHQTEARFTGLVDHQCLGRTSLCPDRCGDSGKLAVFEITRYLAYEKPGQYGDPKQKEFRILIEDNMKNAKVPEEIRDAILALKPGDQVRLDWNHDYVTKDRSKSPERVIVKLEPLAAPAAEHQAPLVGGYSRADMKDERVRKAAEFAVERKKAESPKLALVGIVDAQQQVVAGMNFRLHLKLTDDGKERQAEAVVYLQLDGAMSLTSWAWK